MGAVVAGDSAAPGHLGQHSSVRAPGSSSSAGSAHPRASAGGARGGAGAGQGCRTGSHPRQRPVVVQGGGVGRGGGGAGGVGTGAAAGRPGRSVFLPPAQDASHTSARTARRSTVQRSTAQRSRRITHSAAQQHLGVSSPHPPPWGSAPESCRAWRTQPAGSGPARRPSGRTGGRRGRTCPWWGGKERGGKERRGGRDEKGEAAWERAGPPAAAARGKPTRAARTARRGHGGAGAGSP